MLVIITIFCYNFLWWSFKFDRKRILWKKKSLWHILDNKIKTECSKERERELMFAADNHKHDLTKHIQKNILKKIHYSKI